ncbi:MAG: TonB system transport protein ExbD [Campylobacteraceae bacterium]|jgi:biopolymer transport protein ExbD|nr:TonB system transport protein ExbD [Campylobacteraceae bacterium]
MRLKRPDGMNVVPFIDVMLVLLSIVLTVSTFIAQGKIKVDLPSASSATVKEEFQAPPLELVISEDDKLYINDKEVTIEQFQARVILLRNSDEIVILGDKVSSFGRFIDVIDVLKNKGHENIQIVTKHEKSKK